MKSVVRRGRDGKCSFSQREECFRRQFVTNLMPRSIPAVAVSKSEEVRTAERRLRVCDVSDYLDVRTGVVGVAEMVPQVTGER